VTLRLAGEGAGVQEKVETIACSPGAKDSGDLETGTKTITATAEASGVESADYNTGLTLPKPGDARLLLLRIAARLMATIDSMTAGHLYCRVYVDQQDAEHRLFDEDWTTIGDKLDAIDTHSGALSTIFDLLEDGNAHIFYFFFWVDSGNAVISLVRLWEAVGSKSTMWWNQTVLKVKHTGLMSLYVRVARVGTGTTSFALVKTIDSDLHPYSSASTSTDNPVACVVADDLEISTAGSVATDIHYIDRMSVILRSEQ
jgi:hypothetical protein